MHIIFRIVTSIEEITKPVLLVDKSILHDILYCVIVIVLCAVLDHWITIGWSIDWVPLVLVLITVL